MHSFETQTSFLCDSVINWKFTFFPLFCVAFFDTEKFCWKRQYLTFRRNKIPKNQLSFDWYLLKFKITKNEYFVQLKE